MVALTASCPAPRAGHARRPGFAHIEGPIGPSLRAESTRSSVPERTRAHGGCDRMTWLKRLLPALALSSILTSPSLAQITGHPFEFSAGGGMFAYDTRARLKDGLAMYGSAGYRMAPWATVE